MLTATAPFIIFFGGRKSRKIFGILNIEAIATAALNLNLNYFANGDIEIEFDWLML